MALTPSGMTALVLWGAAVPRLIVLRLILSQVVHTTRMRGARMAAIRCAGRNSLQLHTDCELQSQHNKQYEPGGPGSHRKSLHPREGSYTRRPEDRPEPAQRRLLPE